MIFPNDLPEILYWRCGRTNRVCLPRQPVRFLSTNGQTNAAQVCPQIPYGASGWSLDAREW